MQWLDTRDQALKFYAWEYNISPSFAYIYLFICIFSDWYFQTTWPRSTDCYLWSGWRKSGDLIHSSKMPRVSHFKQWPSPTTTSGFTKTSQFSTWSSKYPVNFSQDWSIQSIWKYPSTGKFYDRYFLFLASFIK